MVTDDFEDLKRRLVVGHKRSGGAAGLGGAAAAAVGEAAAQREAAALGEAAIAASLVASRSAVEALVARFLREARPVPAANRLHRL